MEPTDVEVLDLSQIQSVRVGLDAESIIAEEGIEIQFPLDLPKENVPLGFYNFEDLPNKTFVGHEDHLVELQEWVDRSPSLAIDERSPAFHTLVVQGIAGVGKTTLVRRFVKKVSCKFENIVWIHAETRESLSITFRDIAERKLGISLKSDNGRVKDDHTIASEVYLKLLKFRTLLVFDNAECYLPDVDKGSGRGISDFFPVFIPSSRRQYPKILISSRNGLWHSLTDDVIQVQELSAEDCKLYITKDLASISDVSISWNRLSDYFGNLIIAMESAVGAILAQSALCGNSGYTIEEFLLTLMDAESPSSCTDTTEEFDDDPTHYTYKRLRILWKSTFHTLEHRYEHGKLALDILDTLSFMSPSGVPLKILHEMHQTNGEDRQEAILLLDSLSLLALSEKSVRVHRLLQQTRFQLLTEGNMFHERIMEFGHRYKGTLRLISFKNPEAFMYVDNAVHIHSKLKQELVKLKSVSLLLSIPAFLEYFNPKFSYDAYSYLEAEVIKMNVSEVTPLRFYLTDKSITLLDRQGKYFEALQLSLDSYNFRLEQLGEKHLSTVDAQALLAQELAKTANFDAALKAYENAYRIKCILVGDAHPTTALLKHSIAETLMQQGEYDLSLATYKEALKLKTETLGKRHPSTVATLHSIAEVLQEKGEWNAALKTYEEVLEVKTDKLGESHPETLATKHCIAWTLQLLGNYDLAIKTFEDILEKQAKLQGEDHPCTLDARHNIGQILLNQGKYEMALKNFQQVLELKFHVLGEDHPDTLVTRHSITIVLQQLAKYEAALKSYEEIYAIEAKKLGANHPSTLSTKHSMAEVLQRLGKYDSALQIHQEVLEGRIEKLGPDHPNTLASRQNIADLFQQQAKYDKALETYHHVLELKQSKFENDHPQVLVTRHNIAEILDHQGKYEEALAIFQEILQASIQRFGSDHPNVLATRHSIAHVLLSQGKLDQALKIFQFVLEGKKTAFGHDHPETLVSQHFVAQTLQQQGHLDVALEIFLQVLEKKSEKIGPDHPSTLTTKKSVASILAEKENLGLGLAASV